MGGYLEQYGQGGNVDTGQFKDPFLPYGAPPVYDPATAASGGGTPNREALDFLKGYGTQPLGQQSPWYQMQQQLGQRQLDRNLAGIGSQTQAQAGQMMGNVAARGGLDAATAARLGSTASRAGSQAAQGARGDYADFMSGIGTTDLQQRLGAAGKVAGLEPQYAMQSLQGDKLGYTSQLNQWQAMQQAAANAKQAQAIAEQGSQPLIPSDMQNLYGVGSYLGERNPVKTDGRDPISELLGG
jgi:hypothetical protein